MLRNKLRIQTGQQHEVLVKVSQIISLFFYKSIGVGIANTFSRTYQYWYWRPVQRLYMQVLLTYLLIECYDYIFTVPYYSANLMKFLLRLVRGCRPGKTVHMTEAEVRALCLKSREIFLSQPILLELEAPLKICGMCGWFNIIYKGMIEEKLKAIKNFV